MKSETYRGVVRRVFFGNPERPWMAGILEAEEEGGEIRFSGACCAEVGDKMELVGKWSVHPKFGRQFDVETGLVKMDESPEALVHLLATHKEFEGLGPARARKVVDAALALSDDGEVTSALIEYPTQVAARSGVALEIIENAAKVWGGRRSYFDALAQLGDQGWSSAQAQRIVAKYGDGAAGIVRQEPYMLIGQLSRFGFRTVDTVARRMGVAATDPMRLGAGVTYCLDRIGDNGNTWTTREGLLADAEKELKPDTLDGEDKIREAIEQLIGVGLIYLDRAPDGTELVADAALARVEFFVFDRLLDGVGTTTVPLSVEGPRARAVVPTLNAGQAAALDGIFSHQVGVLSGSAGVGKTYIVRAICEVAEENGLQVVLCAPTGKAARKMEHATSRQAKTIHRTLESAYDEEQGGFYFRVNERSPLQADLVIVDEVSMVDVRLMSSLLHGLRPNCRLLLVGDHHQIPSVGPGAILRDLLSARNLYPSAVHVLTEIVRQAGILARNTTAVLDGVVCTDNCATWGLERTEKGHEEAAAALAAELVEAVVTSPEPLEPFNRPIDLTWDVQVLAPMKKGPLGVFALNVHLQKLRQRLLGNPEPEPTEVNRSPKPLPGDRVIWTKNDYELDLFNGTQAIVRSLPKGGSMLLWTEDGREVTIPGAKRIHVEVAYAMTIHKSQGSEWPFVILVGSSAHWVMHDRNLLYTGASRAAEALTILGDARGVRHFAQERKSASRQTFGAYLVGGWSPLRLPPQGVGAGDSGTSGQIVENPAVGE